MPTYLRWIAAMTAGISMYFTYSIATFGIARSQGVSTLTGAGGAVLAFGAWLVTMVTVLGVNDWLAKRYPVVSSPAPERADDETPAVRP